MNQTIRNEWSISQTLPTPLLTPTDLHPHLRLFTEGSPPSHPDDECIEALIAAATASAEDYTQRAFTQRTVTLKRANLSTRLYLPVVPVQSVDSITYIDQAGDEQTLTDFRFVDAEPAWIEIDSPPAVSDKGRPVTITVTAGYPSETSPPSADGVPASVKHAVKLTVGHFYENRESVVVANIVHRVPQTVEHLLHPLRVLGV